MDFAIILNNLLQPPVLLFLLGLLAACCRSDLDIPQPVPKVLSLVLLLAIGMKGGTQIAASALSWQVVLVLLVAVAFSALTPLYVYAGLRRRLGVPDAAAIAAAYGSVSAITFITAAGFLQTQQIPYGGHMVAAMALMESPAIIVAVMMARSAGAGNRGGWGALLHDAVLNGSVLLLLGSFAIGIVTGERGATTMRLLTVDLFPIVLSLFLLDMGIVAGGRIRDLLRAGPLPVLAALLLPPLNAALAIAASAGLGLGVGDAFLLTVLAASASYIAVPAAMRLAIPEAQPSIYVSMSLAITFPFNVIAGIPLYLAAIRWLWS